MNRKPKWYQCINEYTSTYPEISIGTDPEINKNLCIKQFTSTDPVVSLLGPIQKYVYGTDP